MPATNDQSNNVVFAMPVDFEQRETTENHLHLWYVSFKARTAPR